MNVCIKMSVKIKQLWLSSFLSVFLFRSGSFKGMCKQIDHFPEDADYEADASEYFLRESLLTSLHPTIQNPSPSPVVRFYPFVQNVLYHSDHLFFIILHQYYLNTMTKLTFIA